MRLITACLLIFSPFLAVAAETVFLSEKVPYEPIMVREYPAESVQIFDELTGVAQLYQFEVRDAVDVSYRLKVPYIEPRVTDLNTIVIREEVRGVSEVTRSNGTAAVWRLERNWWTGDRYLVSERIVVPSVEPGIYRLEVSSPSNQGKYVLELGEVSTVAGGVFGQLSYQWYIDRFFGKSWAALLQAMPVWLLLLAVALWLLRRRLASLAGC